MPRAAAPPSLKARALRLLARREHSRAELERKLAAAAGSAARARRDTDASDAGHSGHSGHSDHSGHSGHASDEDDLPHEDGAAKLREQIQSTLDELAARGLLSDERAAESVLAGRGQRLGSRRLKQTLQAKGLDAEVVAATVQRSRATEFERAQALWQRRFGSGSLESTAAGAAAAAERARQVRFLAARGFDADIIRRVVKAETEG